MTLDPFGDEAKRSELARRLTTIPGVKIPGDSLARRPAFDISLLTAAGAIDKFLGAYDWVLSEYDSASQ